MDNKKYNNLLKSFSKNIVTQSEDEIIELIQTLIDNQQVLLQKIAIREDAIDRLIQSFHKTQPYDCNTFLRENYCFLEFNKYQHQYCRQ